MISELSVTQRVCYKRRTRIQLRSVLIMLNFTPFFHYVWVPQAVERSGQWSNWHFFLPDERHRGALMSIPPHEEPSVAG